ncbi:MAG: hypothetical protein HUJ31_14355, partial [Pseudomonadales bacterium]|nr:hypothetical protein [Pseudomonadales bacterium]
MKFIVFLASLLFTSFLIAAPDSPADDQTAAAPANPQACGSGEVFSKPTPKPGELDAQLERLRCQLAKATDESDEEAKRQN